MNNVWKKHFPIFDEIINNKRLVYLDNASTTQKPIHVLSMMDNFYTKKNANIHRGLYYLSEQATNAYENARKNIAKFINAKFDHEIIFVRGATEAINLIASSYGHLKIKQDDEIIISTMEHHSNIIPWQLIAMQTGAKIKVIDMYDNGNLNITHFENLLNNKTKIVAITHVSNTLGIINPIKQIIDKAHAYNIPVMIDGAQAVAHLNVDVQDLDCDFYVFSSHKMYGPTGIGIVYGKENILDSMLPYQGGGGMIKRVTFNHTEYADLPQKFEAGTPDICGAVGLSAAIDFINIIGMPSIINHENILYQYMVEKLNDIDNIKIIGDNTKIGIISFILNNVHPHDIATILDAHGIAIRAGHHCTMPLMTFYKITGTTRISIGLYNTIEDIDIFISALNKVNEIFTK